MSENLLCNGSSSIEAETNAKTGLTTGKRSNYISWEEYFMSVAFLSAQRSKDPATQVGCCIVNKDRKIVGVGYNGMPIGCSDDKLPWQRHTPGEPLGSKYLYVCHAEMNAILNKNSADVRDCTLYVALFPCNECAKLIVQSGIAEVVYLSDKYCGSVENRAAKLMFEMARVRHRQFQPSRRSIVIDFDQLPEEASAALVIEN